jgi:D-alanyl-D-alanine-carboxypeptidase/D-alanyl-D-alanine-endopeptidase
MLKYILVAILSGVTFHSLADTSMQVALDTYTSDTLKGAGVAVSLVNKMDVHQYVSGYADVQRQIPVSSETQFEIGSLTKLFTALALADMTHKGDVALHDEVSSFIPKSGKNLVVNGRPVTLLHLATHYSTLPQVPTNLIVENETNPFASYSSSKLLQFIEEFNVSATLGYSGAYSNVGYGLLGLVLAKHQNVNYEALVAQKVLQPLGMVSTKIGMESDKLHARPYSVDGQEIEYWDVNGIEGAGAFTSNMKDMLLFLQAQLTPPLELKEAIKLTHTSHASLSDVQGQIALSWFIRDTIESDYYWHNGVTGGFRSFIAFNENNQGVVILSNSAVGIDELGHAYMNKQLEDYKAILLRAPMQIEVNEIAKYVGTYELTKNFLLNIYFDEEQLMVKATGQASLPIFKKEEHIYYYKAVKAEIEFEIRGNKVTSLTLFQNGRTMKAPKIK